MNENFARCLKLAIPAGVILWALIIWAALTVSVHAADNVYIAEGAYQGAALADMLTTLDIHRHADGYESNPIIGRGYPREGRVYTYFAVTGLAHAAITYELVQHGFEKTAWAWEAGTIGMELYWVDHNFHTGLSMRF
jgi:hypothetical protein